MLKAGQVYQRGNDNIFMLVVEDYGKFRPVIMDGHLNRFSCNMAHTICPKTWTRDEGFYGDDVLVAETFGEFLQKHPNFFNTDESQIETKQAEEDTFYITTEHISHGGFGLMGSGLVATEHTHVTKRSGLQKELDSIARNKHKVIRIVKGLEVDFVQSVVIQEPTNNSDLATKEYLQPMNS